MSSSENHTLIAQLTAQIASALSTWFGSDAALVSPAPDVRRLKQSFLVRYAIRTADGAPTTLIVKIPRQPEITTLAQAIAATQLYAATRREYDSLRAVANAFADAHDAHLVIRPFTYLPEWNAIVMEQVSADPLKQMLLRPRIALGLARDWQPVENAFTRAGAWLKLFHARLGDAQIESLNPRELQREIDDELARLDRAANRAIDVTTLCAAFAKQIACIENTRAPVVTLHGDFNCGNILIARDGRVGAIDTKRRQRGPIYLDLATVITDPATRKVQVVSHGWFIRARRLARCKSAVLAGYFGSASYDARLLNFYSARAALRKWTLDEETLTDARGAKRLVTRSVAAPMRDYFLKILRNWLTSD